MATPSPRGDGADVRPTDRRGFGKPTELTVTAAASTLVVGSHGSVVTTTQIDDKAVTTSARIDAPASHHVTTGTDSGLVKGGVRANATTTAGGA